MGGLIVATVVQVTAANLACDDPTISPDGTMVAFTSHANNLGISNANKTEQVYIKNLLTGAVSVMTHDGNGNALQNGGGLDTTFHPVFSADSKFITFGDVGSFGIGNVIRENVFDKTFTQANRNSAG